MSPTSLKIIIRVLENAASTEETRYPLCHVRITKNLIQATDGRVLAEAKLDDSFFADCDEIFIHRDNLPYLKTLRKLNHIAATIPSPKKLFIEGKEVSSDEIKFPNLDAIKPKNTTPVFETSFDAQLLLDLAKALSLDDKKVHVKLKFSGEKLAPIMVTVAENEGLLMPVRS